MRRHPGRFSLLVLSATLTVGVGLPDSVGGGAAGFEPAAAVGVVTADANLASDTSTAGSPNPDARDRVSERMPLMAARASQGKPTAVQSEACDSDTNRVVTTTRAHRDDVAEHPDALADRCRLAGPKRFHGAVSPSVATADPAPATPAAAKTVTAAPRWTGGFNLYRQTAFVTQKDFKWCVAASVQMMVNIVRHRSDRTAATQQRMIRYAQASDDGPYGPAGGTDVTGWIAALRHFGAGKYRAVGARTAGAALRIAATAMRQTGRPAGMLVMDGRHAWILHGFESRTDPGQDRWARITSVRVSGPLYPVQQKNGYDLRPNTELSLRALARYFLPSSVGALVGKYVVIVPTH